VIKTVFKCSIKITYLYTFKITYDELSHYHKLSCNFHGIADLSEEGAELVSLEETEFLVLSDYADTHIVF
jgi:hypothetical protein